MDAKVIKIENSNKINNKIGKFIREMREFRGISQYDLGISIGLSEDIAQQHIYKYEKGTIRIPVDIAISIADVLKVDIMFNSGNMIFMPR